MNTTYDDVLDAEPQELHPELSEVYYSIPLEPKQLIRVLQLLYENQEVEIHSSILEFLEEEYSRDFSILFPSL